MRILQIVPTLLPERGGPSRTIPEMCRSLVAQGTDITLFFTRQPDSELTINPKVEPYEVYLCDGAEGSLSCARKVYEQIRSAAREFDVVHIHSVWNLIATAAAAATRRAGVPYVIAPMGMLSGACLRQSHFAAKRAYAAICERRTIEGAARLHLGSLQEFSSLIENWFRYPKHFIARNGTTTATSLRRGSFRARFPNLRDRRIMLFFGRLHAIKGLDLQLEALALLRPKHPDLVWVLVGPDGGEWNRLKAAIQSLGLAENVRWVGPVTGEDRFEALLDSDVLVHTSYYENQAMTINEALGVGVPLVITDSVNYPEVETCGAGYVVKREPAALAARISSVLQAPRQAEKMREAGRRFAASELLWSDVAKTVIHAYEEVLAERENSRVIKAAAQSRVLRAHS